MASVNRMSVSPCSSSGSNQIDLRQKLRAIQQNSSLTQKEKSKQCQELMSHSYNINNSTLSPNFEQRCSHYDKKCSNFVFDCCKITDPCNRCHLARECCSTRPPLISSIMCNLCYTVQTPSQFCTQCAVKFSENYCEICKIWTALNITHCEACGFCRVGTKLANFHCDTCEACFSVVSRPNHECTKKSMKNQNCYYCLESTHTSQQSSVILTCCNIAIHEPCQEKAKACGDYRCPACRKSIYHG